MISIKIAKNRTKLVDKIIDHATDLSFYHYDDMYQANDKFENQDEGKKVIKEELYKFDFSYLHCDEKGDCGVHVTGNDFYNFKIDPTLIKDEIQREIEKRTKRQQKSETYRKELHTMGVSSIPKGMSIQQVKEKLQKQNEKTDPTIQAFEKGKELYQKNYHFWTFDNLVLTKVEDQCRDLYKKEDLTLVDKCIKGAEAKKRTINEI